MIMSGERVGDFVCIVVMVALAMACGVYTEMNATEDTQ